eukprot:6836610-Prymnesium_polylepis.1
MPAAAAAPSAASMTVFVTALPSLVDGKTLDVRARSRFAAAWPGYGQCSRFCTCACSVRMKTALSEASAVLSVATRGCCSALPLLTSDESAPA